MKLSVFCRFLRKSQQTLRSEKLQNESFPNFRIFRPGFCPEFCSEFSPNFSCFASWETETRKNSPKIPAIFQCKIPRQIRRKKSQNVSGERSKPTNSGRKREPKPKLLSPDIFWWGGGFAHEGVGAKKFDMSLEARETKHFWRDIPGFCWDIPGVPEKFEKKEFVFKFFAPIKEYLNHRAPYCAIPRD